MQSSDVTGQNFRVSKVRSPSSPKSSPNGRLTSVSIQDLKSAVDLMKVHELRHVTVANDGFVHGELRSPSGISSVRIRLDSSGSFIPDPADDLVRSLISVLLFVREISENLAGQEGPSWLNDQFQLNIPVVGMADTLIPQVSLKNVQQLQSYWALLDFASQKKSPLPAPELAQYILSRFPQEKWKLQRAALEALLERFNSAKREKLKIIKAPRKGAGHYKVCRKSLRSPLPYELVIASPTQFSGSCNCKDFQKSALGICKHLAAAFSQLPKKKMFSFQGRVAWNPPVTFGAARDIAKEISLQSFSGEIDTRFRPFFEARKNPALLKFSVDDTSPARHLARLEKLETLLKSPPPKALVDSAIFPQLHDETRRLQWQIECEKLWPRLQSEVSKLNVKLFPYQKEGVQRALRAGRFIIADEMGLGKTVQGIAWAEALLNSGAAKKVLVVCPNALKFQWQREWLKTSDRQIGIVEGNPEDRQKIYNSRAPVLIINYEILLRDLAIIKKLSPDAIILDEAQRIKNYMTKTSQYVKSLEPKFRLILTGTPMENRIQELSSLVDWIDNRAMPPFGVWMRNSAFKATVTGTGSKALAESVHCEPHCVPISFDVEERRS